MSTKPVIIVTSKAAQKHLDDVKIKHADILKGMSEQKIKIDALNQQKTQEAQTKQEADRQFNQKQSEINAKSYERTN